MLDHVYRVTEIVGSSPHSIDQAIRAALDRANSTLRRLDWFEVVNVRGSLRNGEIERYQVTIKIGFRLDSVHSETALMDFAPGPDPA